MLGSITKALRKQYSLHRLCGGPYPRRSPRRAGEDTSSGRGLGGSLGVEPIVGSGNGGGPPHVRREPPRAGLNGVPVEDEDAIGGGGDGVVRKLVESDPGG